MIALLILCIVCFFYNVEVVVCWASGAHSPGVCGCVYNLAALPALCVLYHGIATLAYKPLHIYLGNKFYLSIPDMLVSQSESADKASKQHARHCIGPNFRSYLPMSVSFPDDSVKLQGHRQT